MNCNANAVSDGVIRVHLVLLSPAHALSQLVSVLFF